MGKTTETVLRIQCKLTEEEYQSKSKELSRLIREKAGHEDQKRASAQYYKELIDQSEKDIEEILPLVETGSEERDIRCQIEFNVPKKGKKTISRIDTGEVVEIADMTEDEKADMFYNADDEQEPIPFKKAN